MGNKHRLPWILLGYVAALLLVALGFSSLPQSPPPRGTPSVLLLTVDLVRADHVGCYGARNIKTPAIDALAAQGIRFDDALTPVPITLPAHAAILSGTYPMWNGVR